MYTDYVTSHVNVAFYELFMKRRKRRWWWRRRRRWWW